MKLNKRLKAGLLLCIGILFLATAWYTVAEWRTPKFVEQKNLIYSFASNAKIGYRVFLRPNIVYDENFIEEGKYYISKYIDHIEAVFRYEFTGSEEAELNVEYDATAYLQGLYGDENGVLWSKPYELISTSSEKGQVSEKSIERKVNIPLDNYVALKESFYLDTRVNSPVVLNVVFNVKTVVNTPNGTLSETLSPNLVIPIGETVFSMDGNPEAQGGKRLEETVKVRLPLNYQKIALLASFALLLVVAFIVVCLAKEEKMPDAFQKEIRGIFKEYGDRLAGMEKPVPYHMLDIISVNSVEDIVKIADEIGQPVFYYMVDTRTERKIEFYVFDNTRTYYMVIFGEIENTGDSGAEEDTNKEI